MRITELMKIVIWEFYNPKILKLHKKRILKIKPEMQGVNLGCGFKNPPNWLGVDGGASLYLVKHSPRFFIKPMYRSFNMSGEMSFKEYFQRGKKIHYYHHDIRDGLPFADNSVPNVYSSHFLEHLYREDAIKVLRECHRVIRKEGLIRIVVPSLDELVGEIKKALEEYQNGNTKPIQRFVTDTNMGYIHEFSCHKWMYNAATLKKMLEDAGFTQVQDCKAGESKLADIDKLDLRDGIFVEGMKG